MIAHDKETQWCSEAMDVVDRASKRGVKALLIYHDPEESEATDMMMTNASAEEIRAMMKYFVYINMKD